MMEPDEEFRQSPAWRHALSILLERGLPDGTILEKEELVKLFGLRKPITAKDQEVFQLEFMGLWMKVRNELLEEHRIDFKTLHGESAYQVIRPNEQTDVAMHVGLHEMRRAARKMVRSLAFVRHEELTDEECRKNADAQAKAAMLAGMIRNPARLAGGSLPPALPEGEP